MILLLCLAIGLMLGLAAGGSLTALAALRLRGETVLLLLLVAQTALPALSASGGGRQWLYAAWAATFPILVVLCLVNFRIEGSILMAVGVALNATVILLNSGMPVSAQAAAAAGGSAIVLAQGDFAHVVLEAGSRAKWLADVLPIAGPPGFRGVASVGDVVMGCGASVAIAAGMLREAAVSSPKRYAP